MAKIKNIYLKITFVISLLIAIFILIQLFEYNAKVTKKFKRFVPNKIRWVIKDIHYWYIETFGVNFKYKEKKIILSSNNKVFNFQKFTNSFIDYQGRRAYLAIKDDKIFLVLGTGLILSTKIDNFFFKEDVKFKNINTNIKKLIKYKKFYHNSSYGIKGLLVDEKNIYLSLSNEKKKNCFNISIIKSSLKPNELNFSTLYETEKCIDVSNSYGAFQPIQSGGIMDNFNDKELILSVGDYRFRDKSQSNSSDYGKILKVNKITGISKIISKGHRNSQGLFFDKDEKIILSTDHGPSGGDEINIHKNLNIVNNYGWPISSYGKHYPSTSKELKGKGRPPLHKSHTKYGFKEPIIYFTPSIGISQIIKVSDNLDQDFNKQYFVASLGKEKKKDGKVNRSRSLHHIVLDKNFENVIYKDRIEIGSRIRDLKYYKKKKIIFAYLEKDGSIALINK